MNDVRVDHFELALVELLRAKLPTAYGERVDVQSLGDADFDAEGQLVFKPPAARVRFAGADYKPTRDNTRTTYNASFYFEVLLSQSSLRSKADQRKQTLVLVAAAQDVMTGARLLTPMGHKSEPIAMDGVRLVEITNGPVDEVFMAAITVDDIAQFSGANT